ncbi:hypothetical protein Nmel_015998 [Mimus melanotis]
MKSDQQLSLCPLRGCVPAPVLAKPQSYKQRRKVVVVSFSDFYLKILERKSKPFTFFTATLWDHNPLLCLLCSTFWAGLCHLCSSSHCDTLCDSDRNEAVGTSEPAQEKGMGRSMARESDCSRELLPELFVMLSSTIIIRNTSNKY